jgi:hypothetical protein
MDYYNSPSTLKFTPGTLLGFYGFKWNNLAKTDPFFTRLIEGGIMYNSEGCALWVGKCYKRFIGDNEFVWAPKVIGTVGIQKVYKKLILYTYGSAGLEPRYEYLPDCGNPLCLNPEHIVARRREFSFKNWYDFIEEEKMPVPYYRLWTVIFEKRGIGLNFFSKFDVAESMNMTAMQVKAFVKTGRVCKRKFRIFYEEVPIKEGDYDEAGDFVARWEKASETDEVEQLRESRED